MRMSRRIGMATATCAVIITGSLSAVAAVAATGGGQPPAVRSALRAAAARPVDTSTETKFTAITPCRIVDTRVAGGKVTAGSPQSYTAKASNLVAQGGTSGGCNIPSAATAIQANVVAVGAAGSGYLKIYPHGVTAPTASYLNFRDGKALANGGVITLNTSGGKDFTVSTSRTTDVVIDVSGYFLPPLFASVAADGTLLQGSRVATVTALVTGAYEVDFDRDVSKCSYNVTPTNNSMTAGAQPLNGFAEGVFVYFLNASNADANAAFYLTVTC
jgi:hypothetical protein